MWKDFGEMTLNIFNNVNIFDRMGRPNRGKIFDVMVHYLLMVI